MQKNDAGFTLIEVLIALAILCTALVTIIRATSQNIRDNFYLQTKTIANWVGTEVINEVRAGQLKLPEGDGMEKETTVLNRQWSWNGSIVATPNAHIKEIRVIVFEEPTHHKLAQLQSYMYVK